MIRTAIAALCVALALPATSAAAMERTVLVFGGPVTLNDVGEVLAFDNVKYADATIFGVAGGLRWDLPHPRFRFSMEAQLARYFGSQESW